MTKKNSEDVIGKGKSTFFAIISGVFQVIWHVKCLSAILELNCVLVIVIVVN